MNEKKIMITCLTISVLCVCAAYILGDIKTEIVFLTAVMVSLGGIIVNEIRKKNK